MHVLRTSYFHKYPSNHAWPSEIRIGILGKVFQSRQPPKKKKDRIVMARKIFFIGQLCMSELKSKQQYPTSVVVGYVYLQINMQ